MRELSEWVRNMSDDVREANPDLFGDASDASRYATVETLVPRTAAGKTMGSEEAEQIALFQMADAHIHEYPELALLFHCPNGGARHPAVAAKLKAAGVKRGVPDVWLPVRRGGYVGLVIEMKVGDNKPTSEQRHWLLALSEQSWYDVVAYGADEAWQYIMDYLGMPK